MLYYLGSHRWLWGRGWGSQRAYALPPVAAVMLFTAAAHAVHTVHTPANTCTFLATSVISSISHTYRPLAITIHPPAGLPTGIWWNGSPRSWVAPAPTRALGPIPRVVTPPAALERPFQCPAMF